MAEYKDIKEATYDDLVFEGRNKEYGAYVLRKESGKRTLIAFLASLSFFLIFIIVAYWPEPEPEAVEVIEKVVSVSDLAPPPPIKKTPPPPQLKLPPPPKLKFVAPKVTKEEVPEDKKMPTMDDVEKAPVIDNEGLNHLPDMGDVDFNTKPVEIVDQEEPKKPKVYEYVEEMPRFPGGQAAMYKYLASHINYPEMAIQLGIQGTVYLTFVVGTDGSIRDVRLKRGVDKELDAEAIRVVKDMPKWSPGKQNGKAVNVRCLLPVNFTLK